MKIPDIRTARLRLIAITDAMMDAEAVDVQLLQPLLHAHVPPEWPDSNWEPHVFDFIRGQHAAYPHTVSWSRYVVLTGSDEVLIGTVGAFQKSEHEAEFGYAILNPWQSHGYATEAAQALLGEVFTQPHITRVIAHTFPHMNESIRVMEKCGLSPDGAGDEEGTVRYALQR